MQRPTVTDLPERRPRESDREYYDRVQAWLNGEDVRVKTDLKDWKSCNFHLDRSPT